MTESQLELLLRQTIARWILRNEMQRYFGTRFAEELAFEIAEALRADARALADQINQRG